MTKSKHEYKKPRRNCPICNKKCSVTNEGRLHKHQGCRPGRRGWAKKGVAKATTNRVAGEGL
jgi:hypothetical protein